MSGRLVTVVVLNWNGVALLPDCLDALAKQDLPREQWEVWVVDNGSTDGSLELLADRYPDVRVVRNERNLGYAGGNNVALRMVQTPFVALLNNDAHPEPDWLRHLLAPLLAPGAERVAAVTSKVVFQPRFVRLELATEVFRPAGDPRDLGAAIFRVEVASGDGPLRDVTERCLWEHVAYGPDRDPDDGRFRWTRPRGTLLVPLEPADASGPVRLVLTGRAERPKPLTLSWPGGTATMPLGKKVARHALELPAGVPVVDVVNNAGSVLLKGGHGADRGYQEVDQGQYDKPEEVFLFSGTAVALRTEALRAHGAFDERFFMYYEDTDLAWRLQAAGWQILYAPDAVVRHIHAASSVEWSPFFTFHVERNRLLLLAKNAPLPMAAGQALRFQLTTASMLRRALWEWARTLRRPALRPLLLRGKVTASYLRLLPAMLAERRRINRTRTVPSHELLARWLQPPRH